MPILINNIIFTLAKRRRLPTAIVIFEPLLNEKGVRQWLSVSVS
jgi:hypothetical protein